MRRTLAALALVLAVWPACAFAGDVPALVEQAIKSLREKSYIGRLRYMTKPSTSDEAMVQIHHLAPDLYRITPVVQGLPITSYYYVENAAELVKIHGRILHPQPERQYAINDSLTAKFLRDLGQYPGTELLDGSYMDVPLNILRKDVTPDKPYLITVGLRKDNGFPMFLQVVDAQGRMRLHNQFESITFVRPQELKDELFTVPEPKGEARAPRFQQSEIFALPAPAPAAGGGKARDTGRGASGAQADISADLPLYPSWLPGGYSLEAISVLDYAGGKTPAVVYQLEAYGPRLDDMLSVFQMQCDELGDCNLSEALGPPDGRGYLMAKQGDWIVAVFGELPKAQLQKVLDGLDSDRSNDILRLLASTLERDRMLLKATDGR